MNKEICISNLFLMNSKKKIEKFCKNKYVTLSGLAETIYLFSQFGLYQQYLYEKPPEHLVKKNKK